MFDIKRPERRATVAVRSVALPGKTRGHLKIGPSPERRADPFVSRSGLTGGGNGCSITVVLIPGEKKAAVGVLRCGACWLRSGAVETPCKPLVIERNGWAECLRVVTDRSSGGRYIRAGATRAGAAGLAAA